LSPAAACARTTIVVGGKRKGPMNVFILCVAALFLLVWVIYLKLEVGSLSQKVDKLASLLKRYLKDKTSDVEVSRELDVWGKKDQK
jgi:hypothetical protein